MFKNLLILCLLSFLVVACGESKASTNNADNGTNSEEPRIIPDIYANAAIMILENDTLNQVEVYKSVDGRTWSGPATAFAPSEPSIQHIDGKLEDYIVVDNNTMVVSTDVGIYISTDAWNSFRLANTWIPGSTPAKRGIGYVKGNIIAYDGRFLIYNPIGPVWIVPQENWRERNFIFAGVPVLPK